jgi:hypothetical protein
MLYKIPHKIFSISWYFDIYKGITKPLSELRGFADDHLVRHGGTGSRDDFPIIDNHLVRHGGQELRSNGTATAKELQICM